MPPSTIYTLTERDRDGLSRCLDEDIVATGPWAKGPMSLPHRVVLREQPGQYVVHVQVINENGVSYDHGNYFPINGPAAFLGAWECFSRRVRLHHNMSAPSPE